MTKTHIRDRLENFGRYWRDHDGDFSRCRSIEHRYLRQLDSAIAAEVAQDEQASKPPAPDRHDAELVHDAWRRCSGRTKKLLKWSFCMGRQSDQAIANRAHVSVDHLSLHFHRALREIQQILDTPDFGDRIPLDNSSNSLLASAENRSAPGADQSRQDEAPED